MSLCCKPLQVDQVLRPSSSLPCSPFALLSLFSIWSPSRVWVPLLPSILPSPSLSLPSIRRMPIRLGTRSPTDPSPAPSRRKGSGRPRPMWVIIQFRTSSLYCPSLPVLGFLVVHTCFSLPLCLPLSLFFACSSGFSWMCLVQIPCLVLSFDGLLEWVSPSPTCLPAWVECEFEHSSVLLWEEFWLSHVFSCWCLSLDSTYCWILSLAWLEFPSLIHIPIPRFHFFLHLSRVNAFLTGTLVFRSHSFFLLPSSVKKSVYFTCQSTAFTTRVFLLCYPS